MRWAAAAFALHCIAWCELRAHQTELQVFFVADEHIAEGGDLAANLLGLLEPTHGGPELSTVVEVEGADGSLCLRGLHALDHHVRGGRRQGGEDAAAVEPPASGAAAACVPPRLAR